MASIDSRAIPERDYTIPELAKAKGIKAADYADFVQLVVDRVEAGELVLGRLEQQGWSVPTVRRRR